MRFSGSGPYGPSPSTGYRPTAMGPRALSGACCGNCATGRPCQSQVGLGFCGPCLALAGDSSWPSSWQGGGLDDPGRLPAPAVGDAEGAPGWGTPFDNMFQPAPGLNDTRGSPVPFTSTGLGIVQDKPWESTLTPTVNPNFIFSKVPGQQEVRYNNAPVFSRPMHTVPQRPWPMYPNRGTFQGPYGPHALPFYATMMRTPPSKGVPGWPTLRASNTGIMQHHIADRSRTVLASPSYVGQSRRTYATPGIRKQSWQAWPGAQAVSMKGPWDYKQNRTMVPAQSRPLLGIGGRW